MFDGDTLLGGCKFIWKVQKLNYTRFGKPDLNYGWKIKSEPGAALNSKYNFKYKCFLPKSTVK